MNLSGYISLNAERFLSASNITTPNQTAKYDLKTPNLLTQLRGSWLLCVLTVDLGLGLGVSQSVTLAFSL